MVNLLRRISGLASVHSYLSVHAIGKLRLSSTCLPPRRWNFEGTSPLDRFRWIWVDIDSHNLGSQIILHYIFENNFKYVTNMNWWVVFLATRGASKLTKDLSNPTGVGKVLEVPHKPPTAQFWHFHLSYRGIYLKIWQIFMVNLQNQISSCSSIHISEFMLVSESSAIRT